jgi:hypothetical protein
MSIVTYAATERRYHPCFPSNPPELKKVGKREGREDLNENS